VDSDHHLVLIKGRVQGGEENGKWRVDRSGRRVWNEEGCRTFKERMEKVISGSNSLRRRRAKNGGRGNGEGDEKSDKESGKRIRRNEGEKRRGWWDKECKEKKEK